MSAVAYWLRNRPSRMETDRFNRYWMFGWLMVILFLPLAITAGLVWKSSLLFQDGSLFEMLFSSEWKPLSGKFGFLPFILSSLWVTLLALLIAGPVCLFSAIHLTHYAKPFVLRVMQPVVDILAGIPSVIYGVWGIIAIVPFVSNTLAPFFGIQSSGYTLLTGAVVLAVMIIPFILNILIEILNTIPKELTEASLSLGAGKWYTIKQVIMRKAFPGIISAMGLGLSRAFGETIAVLMVVGNVVQIPKSIFDAGYPLPALIANNYGEMLSIPMYDSALMFSALLLLAIVLVFNLVSRFMIIRYENKFR
ncbi:MAG TPA: phosphate ABC transporter permease subunit PstC [Prolixibacteraceae bacterium]|nr:phosphate ABC transporter permease subunit PstC [Prolixibacteraceae bacterium]